MTGEERTLSITGKFRNQMGADLERARREMRAYIDEVHLGAVPFKELSKAAREFFGAAKDVPKIDIAAALAGGPQVTAQAREGYEALTAYAGGLDQVRRAASQARESLAQGPKFDLGTALVGGSTEAVRQVDRVRAALAALGRPVADLVKQFDGPIGKVKDFARQTGETLAFLARPVTAPIGWLRGALDQIFTVRTALAGFLAVSGVRAATNVVTDTIRQTADVARIAQSLNTSAESVSAIRFALQSVGVEGTRVITTFNLLEKAVAQAVRGNRGKIVAFRDLGIDVQELKALAPEELLARIARGLEGIDAQSRTIALQPLFEESFRELIPLLGRGEEAFRGLVREARQFGGIISPKEAQQALEAERALLRIRTALDALKRAAVLDIAAEWAPGLEQLARAIAQNRDLVKGLAEAIAGGITTALDIASRAFIGFVALIDKLPGIDLIDEEKVGRQVAELKRQLVSLQFGPILEVAGRQAGGRALSEADTAKLAALRKREQDLVREIGDLEQTLQGGVAGVLEGARQKMVDAVAQARAAVKEAAAAPPPASRPEPAPARATEDLPGFEQRLTLSRERDILRFQQQIEQLQPATLAVRDGLAVIGAELQKNAALAGEWGDTLGDQEILIAVAAIDEALVRTRESLRRAGEEDAAKFRAQILQIGPATREARRELIELQRVTETLQVQQEAAAGARTAAQARQIEEALRQRAGRERVALDLGDARELVEFRQQLLQIASATEGAQRALAGLAAQAKLLDLATKLNEGSLSLEQFGARAAATFRELARDQQRIGEAFARSGNQAQQFLLGLELQTPEVRKEVAELQAELQKLDLEKLRREGDISPEQYSRGLNALEEGVRRTAEAIDTEAVEATLNWRRELALLQGDSIETAQTVAAIDLELAEVRARSRRAQGSDVTLAARQEQLERERALRDARRYTTAGIWDGFVEGSKRAIQSWQDFAAWGERAAGTINSSLGGALDTLTDIQLGLTDDASEAWKEWGRNALRSIARVINELWAMYLVKLITGFFTSGATAGAGSAGGQQIDIPSVPGGALDGGGALAAGGANGLLNGAGGLKRFGGGSGTTRPGGYGNFGAGGGPGALGAGNGGGGPVTIIEHHSHINLSAVDGESARRFLVKERRTIAQLQADELERTLASRDAVKRVRR